MALKLKAGRYEPIASASMSTRDTAPPLWPAVQPLMWKAEDSIRQLMNMIEAGDRGLGAVANLRQAARELEKARQLLGKL